MVVLIGCSFYKELELHREILKNKLRERMVISRKKINEIFEDFIEFDDDLINHIARAISDYEYWKRVSES